MRPGVAPKRVVSTSMAAPIGRSAADSQCRPSLAVAPCPGRSTIATEYPRSKRFRAINQGSREKYARETLVGVGHIKQGCGQREFAHGDRKGLAMQRVESVKDR